MSDTILTPGYEREGVTLYNGDCFAVLPTLESGSVDAVIVDPPYSSGALHVGGRQKDTSTKYTSPTMGHWSQDKGYPAYCGDNCDQLTWVLSARSWLAECYRVSKEGAHLYMFCDWRQLAAAITALQMGFWQYRGCVVWNKGNTARAPLAGLWRHGAEFILWGAKGKPWSVTGGAWLEGVAPVHNVLDFGNVKDKEHVTQKPVPLLKKLIETATPQGATVLDNFMGSGSTAVACYETGRKFVGVELSPEYFGIASERVRAAQTPPPMFAMADAATNSAALFQEDAQ